MKMKRVVGLVALVGLAVSSLLIIFLLEGEPRPLVEGPSIDDSEADEGDSQDRGLALLGLTREAVAGLPSALDDPAVEARAVMAQALRCFAPGERLPLLDLVFALVPRGEGGGAKGITFVGEGVGRREAGCLAQVVLGLTFSPPGPERGHRMRLTLDPDAPLVAELAAGPEPEGEVALYHEALSTHMDGLYRCMAPFQGEMGGRVELMIEVVPGEGAGLVRAVRVQRGVGGDALEECLVRALADVDLPSPPPPGVRLRLPVAWDPKEP